MDRAASEQARRSLLSLPLTGTVDERCHHDDIIRTTEAGAVKVFCKACANDFDGPDAYIGANDIGA